MHVWGLAGLGRRALCLQLRGACSSDPRLRNRAAWRDHWEAVPGDIENVAARCPPARAPRRRDLREWHPQLIGDGATPPYDVGVVVSFGYFLRAHLLDVLRLGAINMHPSLLPRVRLALIPRCVACALPVWLASAVAAAWNIRQRSLTRSEVYALRRP